MKRLQSRSIKGAFRKVRGAMLKAEQMAMNKTVTATRGKVADYIRKVYNIKKKDLTKISRVKKMGRKEHSVKILFDEKPIALSKFGGKWRGRKSSGATASIKKGQRKTYAGTFMATMKSGHVGIYKRAGEKTKSGKEKLKQYWGASGGQLFYSSKSKKFMRKYFGLRLRKEMKAQLKRIGMNK